MRSFSAIAVLTLASALAAQQNIVYAGDNDAVNGYANAFPFGSVGCRQQELIPGSLFGPNPVIIQDLFVAPDDIAALPWTDSDVVYSDIEIRMGHTSATSMTTTWDTNLPPANATTVYRGPLRIHFVNHQWSPLGLPHPYLWNPSSPNDNLVVDIIHWSVADMGNPGPDINGYFMWAATPTARNVQRAYRIRWTTSQPTTAAGTDTSGPKLGFLLNDGNFVFHGGGCTGSSGNAPEIGVAPGTWPQLGSPLDLRLTNGPQSLVALLSFGIDTDGGGTYPVDLGVIGAPSCFVWHDDLVQSPAVATDPAGNASFLVPVPMDPSLWTTRIYATWVGIDPGANGLGLTTSGYASLILGS